MRRIYKYPLVLKESQTIQMPVDSKIISVQNQHGDITIWAIVDPKSPMRERKFFIHGTGDGLPNNWANYLMYLATVQISYYVWHVFEEIN